MKMILDNLDRIQLTLDYMENNLKEDIQAEDLSRLAGFSLFHYYHLFQEAMGIPVMQYLTRRRLIHAICKIAHGGKMLDTAMEYGFETHAGFYRAFRREYGCSPSAYLKRHRPITPYKINLRQEEPIMISQKRIKELLKHWNLESCSIRDVYYEGSGQISKNDFLICEDYVLKLSANAGKLKRHAAISQCLQEGGLGASTAVPLPDGNLLLQDDGIFCMLCHRPKGSAINSKEVFRTCDTLTAFRFGEMIGQLHLILKNVTHDICSETNLYTAIRDRALPALSGKAALPPSFAEEYIKNFGSIYGQLPKQIIHRNMNLNYLLTDGEKMTGFTDFELSEINIRIFDPCYAATGILSENFEDSPECLQNWLPLCQNILRGYDHCVHLTPEEKEAVPYVILSIQRLCTACFMDKERFVDLAQINCRMLEELAKQMLPVL